MKYMLLMYANEAQDSDLKPEKRQAIAQNWLRLRRKAVDAGVLLDNNGFLPVNDATTLRMRDGKILITDGPFAETHEQLGSRVLLDCQDLDKALHWAAKPPNSEIRLNRGPAIVVPEI